IYIHGIGGEIHASTNNTHDKLRYGVRDLRIWWMRCAYATLHLMRNYLIRATRRVDKLAHPPTILHIDVHGIGGELLFRIKGFTDPALAHRYEYTLCSSPDSPPDYRAKTRDNAWLNN